jgi:hypothetical protein
LKTGGAVAAPTIKLATSTAPIGAPATKPLMPGTPATKPLTPGTLPTATLPKATVSLQPPTQPLGAGTGRSTPSQAPTLAIADDDEAESGSGVVKGLAIVGFVAACGLLALQLMISDIWINAKDNDSVSGWMQLLE